MNLAELMENAKNKTGITDSQIDNLIDAYQTLNSIAKNLWSLNKEAASEEYIRVARARGYLKEFLEKDLHIAGNLLHI